MNYIEKFIKDNDIEVNEEFYVINDKGEKCTYKYGTIMKFYFNDSLALKSDSDVLSYDFTTVNLMSGKYRIEKIPHKHKSVWDLKSGDDYYYIDMCGNVDRTTFGNGTYLTDKKMIEFGNAFLTEEEAEHEVERRKCEAILLKYGTRDMRILGDDNVSKYYIGYDYDVNEIEFYDRCFLGSQGAIYFESKELAQKAIDEVGEDRIKKYVFNVKE